MLDKQDIVMLEGMFARQAADIKDDIKTELRKEFRQEINSLRSELKLQLEQFRIDLKREILEEVNVLILASEKRIILGITEFIDSSILPQIAELQTDMIIVKHHLRLA